MAITLAGAPVSAATQATKQRWKCSASSVAKNIAEPLAILARNLLHREASYLNMRARCEVWYRS